MECLYAICAASRCLADAYCNRNTDEYSYQQPNVYAKLYAHSPADSDADRYLHANFDCYIYGDRSAH